MVQCFSFFLPSLNFENVKIPVYFEILTKFLSEKCTIFAVRCFGDTIQWNDFLCLEFNNSRSLLASTHFEHLSTVTRRYF